MPLYGDGTTFWPVIEAVRDAAGISPDDGPDVGLEKLASLVADPSRRRTLRVDPRPVARTRSASTSSSGRCAAGSRRMTERHGPIVLGDRRHPLGRADVPDLLQHIVETAIGLRSSSSARRAASSSTALPTGGRMAARVVLEPLADADAGEVVANLLGRSGSPRASPIAW